MHDWAEGLFVTPAVVYNRIAKVDHCIPRYNCEKPGRSTIKINIFEEAIFAH
jgi:hypothetical protein